jgi:hypothetical protein
VTRGDLGDLLQQKGGKWVVRKSFLPDNRDRWALKRAALRIMLKDKNYERNNMIGKFWESRSIRTRIINVLAKV